MIKRIVIAGSREYKNCREAKEIIEHHLSNICKENEIVILSGGCRGADLIGERYAEEKGNRIERHLADWEKYGRGAGPKRNEEMAKLCDCVICFWDGRSKGTKSMLDYAKKYNKLIRVKLIGEQII